MNKDMFLMQLEQLLSKIPREEREEAMDYYRSYFEDAGMENEAHKALHPNDTKFNLKLIKPLKTNYRGLEKSAAGA